MSWADDLQKLAMKGSRDLGLLSKKLKFDIFSDIIKLTRVDTGRLKGNWQISENQPATGTIENLDPTGSKGIQNVSKEVTADGITYFVNNLPYAPVWEERDAMVARSVAKAKANIKTLVNNLK